MYMHAWGIHASIFYKIILEKPSVIRVAIYGICFSGNINTCSVGPLVTTILAVDGPSSLILGNIGCMTTIET